MKSSAINFLEFNSYDFGFVLLAYLLFFFVQEKLPAVANAEDIIEARANIQNGESVASGSSSSSESEEKNEAPAADAEAASDDGDESFDEYDDEVNLFKFVFFFPLFLIACVCL